ncbi:MAG: PepSY-associated TM helix domain-containing protein, partial [Sphingomonadaceae bacterium]
MAQTNGQSSLYRAIWRWHFYAGLFIIPMILILSVTGAMYLFKPQVERWEEHAFQGLPTTGTVTPSIQRDAALAAFPGSRFLYYRLPERPGDAALVHLELPGDGKLMRDVFVSPQGKVLGGFDPDRRAMEVVHDIHGQLMLGHRGSWLVELAASWAIVLIATGLFLWWPKGTGLSGVLWLRFGLGRRILLRDLHAVTGFWVAGFAMILLLTGLPWAEVWGSGFKAIRTEMGWIKGEQDWTIGGRSVGSEHAAHMNGAATIQNVDPRGPIHTGTA